MLKETTAFLFLSLVAYSAACGGFFCAPQQPVVQSGEAIIFGVKGRNVTMHVQINYQGPAEDFSWLLPVMFEPTLTASSDPFFQSMFRQTLPQFSFQIDTGNSTSCDPNMIGVDDTCAPQAVPAPSSPTFSGVEVKEGSVGPFDFQIIKAVNQDVSAIRNWLAENGYDEYAGSVPIIAHYVKSDHYFVALRLKKDTDTGDLVPIAINYEMPEAMDTVACIPLILTGVAATETMPIQVYILGDSRADPVNYFRVELDETKVDWLGCQFSPACFDRDYRQRAASAFRAVNDHAFIEEFAGRADVMEDQIRFDINDTALAEASSVLEFLNTLSAAGVPSFGLLDGILNDHVPLEFSNEAPFFCSSLPSIYNPTNPFQMDGCVSSLLRQDYDLAALAAEIRLRVLDPAEEAQRFTDSFKYLTRLWVSMRQEQMVKDPFFQFRESEVTQDRSNVHSAVGVPVCDKDLRITELEIRVPGGPTSKVPASFQCGSWFKTNFDPLYGDKDSPAFQLVVPGFGTEDDRILSRKDGTFDEQAILDAFILMDDRVMDQTIEPFPTAPCCSPSTDKPVSPISTTPAPSPANSASPPGSSFALNFALYLLFGFALIVS